MLNVDDWAEIRRLHRVEGMSMAGVVEGKMVPFRSGTVAGLAVRAVENIRQAVCSCRITICSCGVDK
jgi:hypothetical protein